MIRLNQPTTSRGMTEHLRRISRVHVILSILESRVIQNCSLFERSEFEQFLNVLAVFQNTLGKILTV